MPKRQRELITRTEYARRRGLAKSTVHRQVTDGLIPAHGSRKLIDPAEADAARAQNVDPIRGGKRATKKASTKTPQSEASAKSAEVMDFTGRMAFAQARAIGQEIKNERDALELRRLRGQLIDRDSVSRAVAELAQAAVAAWIQWPARVYAQMAAELGVDGAKLHHVLDKHVRQHADEVSEARLEFRIREREKTA